MWMEGTEHIAVVLKYCFPVVKHPENQTVKNCFEEFQFGCKRLVQRVAFQFLDVASFDSSLVSEVLKLIKYWLGWTFVLYLLFS